MLYFAYGANLCKAIMAAPLPGATPLCAAYLPDYRLVFRQTADIELADGEAVPGALWALIAESEEALDRFEGIGEGGYQRSLVRVRRSAMAGKVEAMAYHASPRAYAQQMAAHSSARTTKLYDRRGKAISLDEVEKISF